jgi:valyl-tRNA synthetase
MAPAYEPADVEKRRYAEWIERGYFHAEPNPDKKPYCIVLPPPNVTGALHMGHALDHTLQDIVIRRKRMQGFETLWLPGTDHAGIATEVLVERQLLEEGLDKRQMGRGAFLDRVWEWKEKYGNRIVEQMKGLGNSCDWDRLRFTMDEGLQHAVRVAFVRQYDDGLIYRGDRIINWCPTDRTALSDSEVEHEDVEGELITFRYELSDGSGHIDVATTRIETMLGDTGVAVQPGDERYRALVGKTVRHPFGGEELPIVADEAVDPGFGTGAVKITPAHDPTDFEIAARAGLPSRNILNADATISDAAPQEFRGLDRNEARKRVLEALRQRGLIVNEERPYVHSVGHCYRCHSELEPWLSGKQWFVSVERLVGPAKEVAEDGRLRFFPERWRVQYTSWLDNLRDWNISRQLWWGHRIPVWYCKDGHEFASVEDPAACRECGSKDIDQDPDVLDTWFSSQLWPFSTLGWPEKTPELEYFYPTSVLVTGYEILYLWVARMVMSGMYFMDDVPFRHALIHGLVRDERNRKMSKSLGNVIDPLDVIAEFGADALRFALARLAGPDQQNYPFGMRDAETGRNFANKIWNAARLVLGEFADEGPPVLPPEDERGPVDRWLLSRAEACRAEVDAALEAYRFDVAAQSLQRFLWSEYCDWGLEMSKPRLYEGSPDERHASASVLAWTLERSLRLLHPIMPFVTEEIWQRFGIGDSIVISEWPEPHAEHRDQDAERGFSFAEDLVVAVRSFRSGHRLGPGTALDVRVHASAEQARVMDALADEIRRVGRIGELDALDGPVEAQGAARIMVQGAEVLIPLTGVLDPEEECGRIRGRLEAIAREAEAVARKLENRGFTEKAPPEVVEKQRHKLKGFEQERAILESQLAELGCS